MAAKYLKLTHYINKKTTAPLYLNPDQIVMVCDSIGADPRYPTTVVLANGQVNVTETVAQVMQGLDSAAADA